MLTKETRDKCCFATFRIPQQARASLEDLNSTTNLKAVYRTREPSDKVKTGGNSIGRRTQGSNSLSLLGPSSRRNLALVATNLTFSDHPNSSPSAQTIPTQYPTVKQPSTPSRSIYDCTLQQHVPMRNFWSVLVDDFSSSGGSDYDGDAEGTSPESMNEYDGDGPGRPISQQMDYFSDSDEKDKDVDRAHSYDIAKVDGNSGDSLAEGSHAVREDKDCKRKVNTSHKVSYTPLVSHFLPTPPSSSSSTASTPTRHHRLLVVIAYYQL